MSSHLLIRRVDELGTAKPSYVMWSVEPATTVIFFVHGFLGSALSTWRQFDSLAPEDSALEKADLVFLGYKSVRRQTNISADELLDSCQRLIEGSAAFMNATIYYKELRRSKTHRYQRVIFVAHSLGAIVTRRLLLLAQRKKYSWLDNARIVLFAPAHNGATDVRKLPESIARMAGPLSPVFRPLISWKAQTLSEVKVGSNTLQALKTDTATALEERNQGSLSLHHLIAKRVIFGSDEDVVQTERFCGDPDLERVPDKGHQNICKPKPDYRDPVTFLHESESNQ